MSYSSTHGLSWILMTILLTVLAIIVIPNKGHLGAQASTMPIDASMIDRSVIKQVQLSPPTMLTKAPDIKEHRLHVVHYTHTTLKRHHHHTKLKKHHHHHHVKLHYAKAPQDSLNAIWAAYCEFNQHVKCASFKKASTNG